MPEEYASFPISVCGLCRLLVFLDAVAAAAAARASDGDEKVRLAEQRNVKRTTRLRTSPQANIAANRLHATMPTTI